MGACEGADLLDDVKAELDALPLQSGDEVPEEDGEVLVPVPERDQDGNLGGEDATAKHSVTLAHKRANTQICLNRTPAAISENWHVLQPRYTMKGS